jgi:hypothetical protein
LQLSLALAPLGVDSQYVVDPCLISDAARRQALTDEIGFLTDQTDVEHGADYSTNLEALQILQLYNAYRL